jgi:DNA-binding transcriptional MerR regulator
MLPVEDMAMHLKIGEFARLAHVSLKTLHHYDAIGLLQPAYVDQFTSYRYYTLEQLPRLTRILALRNLGFTLEQAALLLDEHLSVDQLRGMLRLRRAQLEQEIASAQDRLAQVDIRLRWIEEEKHMPQIEVLRKDVPESTVAGVRKVAAATDNAVADYMREHCIALDRQVCRYMQDARLVSVGVSLALYYAGEEAVGGAGEGIDVEMAYGVTPPAVLPAPAGGTRVHMLPATEVVYAIYHGSYDDFAAVGQLHAAIRRWIEERGLQASDPVREYYLQPPRSPRNPVGVMEIQYPLR